jgi:hypothetical protein
MKRTIVGKPLLNLPWQGKPTGDSSVVWRYDRNPVAGLDALIVCIKAHPGKPI